MIPTLLTVVLYAAVYSAAILVFRAAQSAGSFRRRKLILACGVLFLAAFAAMRHTSVGTDTADTIALYFTNQHGRPMEIRGIKGLLNGDIPYYAISNVLHMLRLGTKSVLFVSELLILTPVAISAYLKRDRIPMHVTMLLFILLHYQVGFNWIRQSIASGLILLAVVCAQEKRPKSAILAAFLAAIFHSSALIGLALLLFIYAFMRIKNKRLRIAVEAACILLFVFLLFQWERIFSLGISYGLFPERYAGYLRVFSGQTTVESWFRVGKKAYVEILIRGLLVVTPFILLRKKQMTDRDRRYAAYSKMVGVVGFMIYSFVLVSMHSTYGNRLTYAVEYVMLLSLGMCYSQPSGQRLTVPMRNLYIFGLALLYHVWVYYVLGWHGTVPFVFG